MRRATLLAAVLATALLAPAAARPIEDAMPPARAPVDLLPSGLLDALTVGHVRVLFEPDAPRAPEDRLTLSSYGGATFVVPVAGINIMLSSRPALGIGGTRFPLDRAELTPIGVAAATHGSGSFNLALGDQLARLRANAAGRIGNEPLEVDEPAQVGLIGAVLILLRFHALRTRKRCRKGRVRPASFHRRNDTRSVTHLSHVPGLT